LRPAVERITGHEIRHLELSSCWEMRLAGALITKKCGMSRHFPPSITGPSVGNGRESVDRVETVIETGVKTLECGLEIPLFCQPSEKNGFA
jgi:hypothetical protein